MSKELTLVPYGGLANRMKAIASVVTLTNDMDIPVRIIWYEDEGLNCSFDNLFYPIDTQRISLQKAKWYDFILNDRPRQKNLYIPKLFQSVLFKHSIYGSAVLSLVNADFDFKNWLDRKGKKFMTSCYSICSDVDYDIFKPIDALQREIERRTNLLSSHSIGVHIRRTDNIVSIKSSPTDLFLKRMEKELLSNPDTSFYLATDSEEVKDTILHEFGTKVVTSDKKADRNSIEGMQEGLIEMYCLSRTNLILGSVGSSYSETASAISHVSFAYIKA